MDDFYVRLLLCAVAVLLAAMMTLACAPAMRALPEPSLPAHELVGKTPYAQLTDVRFVTAVGCCTLAALLMLVARVSPGLWPVWLGLSTVGVMLVCVDAATTWLPLPLTHGVWALTAVGALACLAVDGAGVLLRLLCGALVMGVFWWACWRFVGGLGFGDVRLAPVLGAAAAAVSWQVLVAGMVLGPLVGAVYGLSRLARGRHGPFPYGPSLVIGMYAALLAV